MSINTVTNGTILTAKYFGSIASELNNRYSKASGIWSTRLWSTTGVVASESTYTTVSFNQEIYDVPTDSVGMHSNTVNPERITAAYTGLYGISTTIRWPDDPNGRRLTRILLNGTTILAQDERGAMSSGGVDQTVMTYYYLAVGQYITVDVRCSSSSGTLNLAIVNVSPLSPSLSLTYYGPVT